MAELPGDQVQVVPHKVIVLDSEQLYQEVRCHADEYLPAISCWRDQTLLHLEELPIEWELGYYRFAFGPVPAYRCGTCGDTHFPAHVLQTLSTAVEKKLKKLDTRPRFHNPDRIRAKP